MNLIVDLLSLGRVHWQLSQYIWLGCSTHDATTHATHHASRTMQHTRCTTRGNGKGRRTTDDGKTQLCLEERPCGRMQREEPTHRKGDLSLFFFLFACAISSCIIRHGCISLQKQLLLQLYAARQIPERGREDAAADTCSMLLCGRSHGSLYVGGFAASAPSRLGRHEQRGGRGQSVH